MAPRFLQRSNDRTLPGDYRGDVLLWDIDKTYLDTHFSSWRGLAAIPFEFALDKETVPGAVPLLRALRRGAGEESALVPLYFVSGSPLQLRRIIERRMTLDGIEYDGITFKDQLGLLLEGRPRAIVEQVGYKLSALLLYRRELPDGARWLLFGDDVEADAEVFALFGEVCAGLRGEALEGRLRRLGVHRSDVAGVLELCRDLPVTEDPVERIFIHLERGTDPAAFAGSAVVATRSYLQTALVLADAGRVRPAAVTAVAMDLRRRGVTERRLEADVDDAVVRLTVPRALAALTRR